jgi:hypothetical protein
MSQATWKEALEEGLTEASNTVGITRFGEKQIKVYLFTCDKTATVAIL